jgi:hypothetical protein
MEGAASASTLAALVTTSRPLREYVGMEIRRARFSDAEVEPLLAGLSQEYDTRYGENVEMTRASADEFDPPSGFSSFSWTGRLRSAAEDFVATTRQRAK